MALKAVSPGRAADILENAAFYVKDSLRRVGPNVCVPRCYAERLQRDLRRASDQLRIFVALDVNGCIAWPGGTREEPQAADAVDPVAGSQHELTPRDKSSSPGSRPPLEDKDKERT